VTTAARRARAVWHGRDGDVIRQRDGRGSRSDGPDAIPSSVSDLGRMLRRARTRQGFRLEDISARTGMPLDQLQILETGSIDRIPDRVATLKILRQYSDLLGLPGERIVIAVVDHWPATPAVPPSIPAYSSPSGLLDTGGYPVTTAVSPLVTPIVSGVHPRTEQTPLMIADTMAIGVGRHAPPADDTRPPVHAPLALRVLVALVVAAMLIAGAGLVIDQYEPHWLDTLGITRSVQAEGTASSTTAGTRSAPASTGTSAQGTAGTVTSPAGGPAGGKSSSPKPTFAVTSTSPSTASFTVGAPAFDVQVRIVGGESWIQGTQIGKATPTYSGLLDNGQSKTFSVQQSFSLEVGSVAARVFVTVATQIVGSYNPPAAPYTMTFVTGK